MVNSVASIKAEINEIKDLIISLRASLRANPEATIKFGGCDCSINKLEKWLTWCEDELKRALKQDSDKISAILKRLIEELMAKSRAPATINDNLSELKSLLQQRKNDLEYALEQEKNAKKTKKLEQSKKPEQPKQSKKPEQPKKSRT